MVEPIGAWLMGRGLRVWYDSWELRPGFPWQEGFHDAMAASKAGVAFVGRASGRRVEFADPMGIAEPTAGLLNNLALLYDAKALVAEAEPLMRRALVIAEKRLGAQHPELATPLNNLGQLLQATDRLAEAEPLMRRVLEIFHAFEHTTGYQHPHRALAFDNYSRLLTDLGRS